MIKDKDGKEVGIRLEPFDYTAKKLLSISAYRTMVQQEVTRVRNLSPSDRVKQRWAGMTQRPDGTIWMKDPVIHLSKIGVARQAKLESVGVTTVEELASLTSELIINLSHQTRMSVKTLTEYRDQALTAETGYSPYPKPFDYVEGQENPYLHRYGVDEWEKKIKTVSRSGFTRVRCVTELVEHIDRTTAAIYKGTQFEKTYVWAHDALSQMTDNDCKAWMKDKGYWKHWITPVLECNDEVTVFDPKKNKTVTSRNYKERPVGDQPEMMPLDASLNWDIDSSLNMHSLLTAHLDKTHKYKFRKDTPNEISKAIMKICHPVTGVVPTSKRIIEDCRRVVKSAMTIVKAGGKIVPGLVNRNGHRNKRNIGRKYYPRKKVQVIKTMDDLGIFKDVQKIAMKRMAYESAKFD